MSRLAAVLLRRSVLRSAGLVLILALVGTISLIFAWMSPSIRAAELSGWERLPANLTIGDAPASGGECLTVYDGIALAADPSSTLYAHAIGLAGGAGLVELGLAARNASSLGVLDQLAAVEGGLHDGDEVTLSVPRTDPIRGRIEVIADAVSVRHRAGSMGLNLANATVQRALGVVDGGKANICLGGAGPTVAEIRGQIERRQSSEGLAASTGVFAAIALGALGSSLLLALAATQRRRTVLRGVMASWGQPPQAAALVGSIDVLVAAAIGLGIALWLAWWLRSEVLHLWTAAAAVLVSGGGLFALVLIVWTLTAVITGRKEAVL